MTEIQKVFKSVISNLKYSRPSNEWPALFWLHWFLLGNEVRLLSIACNSNLFISLAMKMLFFIVIINGFNAQSPAPGLYLSRYTQAKETEFEFEFSNDHGYNRKKHCVIC